MEIATTSALVSMGGVGSCKRVRRGVAFQLPCCSTSVYNGGGRGSATIAEKERETASRVVAAITRGALDEYGPLTMVLERPSPATNKLSLALSRPLLLIGGSASAGAQQAQKVGRVNEARRPQRLTHTHKSHLAD